MSISGGGGDGNVGSDFSSAELAKIAADQRALLEGRHYYPHHHGSVCDGEKHPLTSSPAENISRRKTVSKRPKHPDGLPFVSVERCHRIDDGSL